MNWTVYNKNQICICMCMCECRFIIYSVYLHKLHILPQFLCSTGPPGTIFPLPFLVPQETLFRGTQSPSRLLEDGRGGHWSSQSYSYGPIREQYSTSIVCYWYIVLSSGKFFLHLFAVWAHGIIIHQVTGKPLKKGYPVPVTVECAS